MLSFLFLFLILLFFKLYRFFYFTLHLFDVFSCCLGFFVFQLHCFVLVVLFHLYHSIVSIPTSLFCSCCFVSPLSFYCLYSNSIMLFINRTEEPLVFVGVLLLLFRSFFVFIFRSFFLHICKNCFSHLFFK